MSARKYTIALSLLAILAQTDAYAQTDARATLAGQGKYWMDRGDHKRATEIWQKLLLVSPNDPQALYGLAAAELDKKNLTAANQYLQQLRQSHPGDSHIALLEQDIYFSQPGPQAELNQARTLAVSGQMDEAIAQYDKALQGKPPLGPLGFEYYRYLGYSSHGLDRAVRELTRLHRANPNNAAYELALAQHLVRNLDSRPDGLRRLERLARNPAVGSEANETWRSVLTWVGTPNAEYRPFFQSYLAQNPNDTEIRQLLQGARTAQAAAQQPARQGGGQGQNRNTGTAAKAWVQAPLITKGFKALEDGDLNEAENAFREQLAKEPNNPDALGGLGVVRMQQNDLPQAEKLLERAAATRPQWRKALNNTRYWMQVNAAASALGNDDLIAARRHAEAAIRLDSKDPAAQNALGHVQVEEGKLEEATRTFARVFNSNRNNIEALTGLISVLAQRGQPEQALDIIEKLTPEQRAQINDIGQLRAAVAAGQAKQAEQRGDEAGARLALENAIRQDPNNPWLRFDLARLYLKIGANTEAQGLVDGLLISNPDMPDALYSSALLQMQLGSYGKAHATLLRIPEDKRTPTMAALEHRLWVHAQAEQASLLAQRGQVQDARRILLSLENAAGQDPELLGTIASAYTDTGDAGHGLNLLRQQMARSERPNTSLLLAYSGLLLKTGQDVEAANILRTLQSQRMNRTDQQAFDDLLFLYTVRQADLLRERGDLVAAYDTLAPALAQRPNDELVQGALARMYAAGGDHAKALDYYKLLLAKDPDNADLQIGAAMMATELRDYRYAETAINHAVALAPDNPEILANAARLYRARGKTSQARDLLNAAIAAEERRLTQNSGSAQAQRLAQASSDEFDNPFVGLPNQRTRSTLPPQALADILDREAVTTSTAVAVAAPAAQVELPPFQEPAPVVQSPAPLAAYPSPSRQVPEPVASTRQQTIQAAAPQPVARPAATVIAPAQGAPMQGQAITIARPASSQTVQTLTVPTPSSGAMYDVPLAASQYSDEAKPVLANGVVMSPRLEELRKELYSLQESANPEVRVGVFGRSNNGEKGTSRVNEISAPLEVRLPALDGTVSVRATPVTIDAGRVGTGYYDSSRFGGGPAAAVQHAVNSVAPGSNADAYLHALNGAEVEKRQRDSGIGLSVGYATQGLSADIGTTPLGFQRTNVVGGIKLDGMFDPSRRFWYTFDISRRAVTDSVLSFAGTTDSRTGQSWGGVTATGFQFQLGQDNDDLGYYAYGGWHALRGHNVKSNWRINAGAGTYWHLLRDSSRSLTAGLNLAATFYDKNLRFFTYGHGGYFSPQSMYALSVPFTWAQRGQRFSYKLQGAVGLQHFDEKSADYFPGSSVLQSQAEAAAIWAQGIGMSGATARYSGQSSTGVGYNLLAAGEYRLSNNLTLGGQLSLDNATDYRQWGGGLYLRYTLYPVTSPLDLPVNPYQSPYAQ